MRMRTARDLIVAGLLVSTVALGACAKKQPPLLRPAPPPPPPAAATPAARPPAPPSPVREPPLVPPEPVLEDSVSSRSLDDLNRESPFQPALFEYDSADITPDAQRALDANAVVLRKYPTLAVTIEGHSDERGTAEYNLALGERRAIAARSYLVSLGIAADRLRTVSYGKEFPFNPGHDDRAWSQNRRAHFVITAK
jgi:peptidoglycan-associated lipoprotein